jgi:ArsR family transcriptional regulator, arsenate/arsenite/antimonite-responsive transcriptional repressor
MNIAKTVDILTSLAQETRLKTFKALVRAGLNGITAGEIGQKIKVPQNTMSFHLSHLKKSGLIRSSRQGRNVIYSANFDETKKLVKFLLEDCCSDSKEKCPIALNPSDLF